MIWISKTPVIHNDKHRGATENIPWNTRDLLIQVLAEQSIGKYAIIDDSTKQRLRIGIQVKIDKKINTYTNRIIRLIVRIWYALHPNILDTELQKTKKWLKSAPYSDAFSHLLILDEKSLTEDTTVVEKLFDIIRNTKSDLIQSSKDLKDPILELIKKMKYEDLAVKHKVYLMTPLTTAIYYGHKNLALAVIERLDPKDLAIIVGGATTALIMALQKQQEDIALELIKKMNREDLVIQGADSPLVWAICHGHKNIALALIEKLNPEELAIVAPFYKKTPLEKAILGAPEDKPEDNTEIILKLIEKMLPKDLVKPYTSNKTPLSWAVSKGYQNIVNALIERLNPEDLNGRCGNMTYLAIAIRNNHTQIALSLLNAMQVEKNDIYDNLVDAIQDPNRKTDAMDLAKQLKVSRQEK